ncbi:MAG TPA: RNA methyltransferase [Acidimicrobiales bacterium]|nr:RNA methyltransferase [Acidimicrobiales bacterium]
MAVAVIEVDDPSDVRLGDFYGLNDPELRRRRESDGEGDGFLVAEGVLVIRQLLASPYPVRSLLVTAKGLADLEADLDGVDAPVYLIGQTAMTAVTGFAFHRGALAAAARRPPIGLDEVADGADLLVVAEGVNDNENLGGLFRNAAAFGAAGLVLDRASADPLYRRAIRVSMGHSLRLPFARVASAPAALAWLRAAGFEVLALTPSSAGGSEDVRSVARRPRQALVVGAEGPGLTDAALASADRRIRIPMAAGVDSLNVATAAAVALSQLSRSG